MPKPVWTLEQIVENFERYDAFWPVATTISYTFLTQLPVELQGNGTNYGFSAFIAAQKTAAGAAFALISDVAAISFAEIPDNGHAAQLFPTEDNKITFANSSAMPSGIWGSTGWGTYQPAGDPNSYIYGAEIWVSSNAGLGSYGFGTYNRMALLHEIGHALGLPHPGEYDASEGTPTYAADAEYAQDTRQYTVMSYFSASNSGASHGSYYASTLLLHDIAALQAIYGANTTIRTGDTVYGYHSTAGNAAFDFTQDTHPIVAIWDAGGTDTLDLSGYSKSRIDLNEGGFSDSLGLTKNIAIAYGTVIENAIGGSGNDSILGNGVGNVLNGGGGSDTIDGAAGADTLIGGVGNDNYVVGDFGDAVTEAASAGTDLVSASIAAYTLPGNVETLKFIGAGNFTGTGNGLNNSITGGGGNDTIDGAAGNDTLDGADGSDIMAGGLGNDTFLVDSASDSIVEAAGAGTDTAKATASAFTLYGNIENLTFVGAGNFSGTGNSLNNSITGGAANDTLDGAAGNDVLNGAGGDDVTIGGLGNDSFIVDSAGDAVIEAAGGGTDTVKTILASLTIADNVENLTFTGTGGFAGTGNGLTNTITGAAGSDTLDGAAGNDALDGGAGADLMTGGLGNDSFTVDNAGDSIVENLGGGTDTVRTKVASFVLGDNIENLIFTGTGAFAGVGNTLANTLTGAAGHDTLDSGEGNDTLFGMDGNDSLSGGIGNDRLTGGSGADLLAGGAGGDRFIFSKITDFATGAALDGILDFTRAESDRIDLASLDANTGVGGNQTFLFLGAAGFAMHAGELNYAAIDGGFVVQGDVNGDAVADFAFDVMTELPLLGTDFFL